MLRDMSLVLIAIGGAAGAVSRYLVDSTISQAVASAFPWGTLAINLSGSFLLGLLFALATERGVLPAEIRGPVMIGFVGAYTTFSTWMLESWRLVEDGSLGLAAANLAGSLVLGVAAVFLGLTIGRAAA
jgi:fluoride exporter